jgi:hypothetical protein
MEKPGTTGFIFYTKKSPLQSTQRADFSRFSEPTMLKGNFKTVETPSFPRPIFHKVPGK